jgi:hypothetical protein
LGTEVAQPDEWPAGSLLVRLDQTPQQILLNESSLGQERHYRVGPGDRFYTDPSFQHAVLAFEGIGLRPYSPVHLKARPIVSGDVQVDWIRRTRFGGDRWEILEVPLAEESESYLVRISQGGQVLREDFTSTPSWIYTASQKSADGIVGFFDIEVAQISASFGPGAFAKFTFAA